MTETEAYDPRDAVAVLLRHGVRFVVIGGVAANLRGSPSITADLDVCYERDSSNFSALARALRELGATLRGAPAGIPFQLDAETLRNGDAFTFQTRAGNLDCLGTPRGTGGYQELAGRATLMDVGAGAEVLVAALDDLISMKRAAGRPKDLVEVEILHALRDELRRGSSS